MKAEPNTFTQELQKTLGNQLRSVILYGSRVTGDFVEKRSDYNLLVVVSDLSFSTLKLLRAPISRWIKAGQRPPLLFTEARLQQSADIFPIELHDLRDQRKVLQGEDLIAKLELTDSNLRHQLESELKGKLIALREGYFACEGRANGLVELVIKSLANFQVLMRAALRLHNMDIPQQKDAVIDSLASRISIDTQPFHQAAQLKDGRISPKSVDGEDLFARYLAAVEQLVDAVDAHKV